MIIRMDWALLKENYDLEWYLLKENYDFAEHMLSFFLKRLIDFISLISLGNLFQQFLPWNETVFSPYSSVFVLIGCRSFLCLVS